MADGKALPPNWNQYPTPSAYELGQQGEWDVTTLPEEDDVSLISDVLGGVYTAADQTLGGWLPNIGDYGVSPGMGVAPVYNLVNGSAPAPQPPAGTPVMTTTAAPTCGDDPMRGMVYKKVCGSFKWVKQKRRRRKRLASQCDLKDLAALKGVLGGGKAFEVWIATHS